MKLRDHREHNLRKDTSTTGTNDRGRTATGGDINPQRRKFSRLGLTAPVLLSLSSRPVFAGNCISNMMSGNISPAAPGQVAGPERGNCMMGANPNFWLMDTTLRNNLITLLGLNIFANGHKLSDSAPTWLGTSSNNHTYDWYLGESNSNNLDRNIVTAFLNALYSSLNPAFDYIVTLHQLELLCIGSLPPPGGDLSAFLEFTWSEGVLGESDYSYP